MRVKILFLIIISTLGAKTNATNYYFSDSEGDDFRSSTQAQNPSTPWKGLSKLNSWFEYLKPGDSIFFKRGDTFYGSILTSKSGTRLSPIVLAWYGGGSMPIISGFTTVTGWSFSGNGVYESDVLPTGGSVNLVTINGKEYAMGRYPNPTSANKGYLLFESHGFNSITDNENILSNNWVNAQLVVRTTHGSIETSSITNVSGKTISYNTSFEYSLSDGYGYFVQNDIKTLDQIGEWYYNPSTHKLSVYFGSNNPSSYAVQVSAIDFLLIVQSSNIVFDGLHLRGANSYALYADWSGTSNLQVKNCKIGFSGINGVALAGTINFLMDNCTIQNSNSNGIDLHYNNRHPTITNTTIKNTGTFNGMMKKDVGNRYGIAIYSSQGLTAVNNKIVNTGYSAIYFTGDNNLIKNNYIDSFCTILDDGGAIYSWGGKSNPVNYNRKVMGNIVLHGIGAKDGTYSADPNYVPAEGIYMDANSTNVEVLDNTVAYCANSGIYVHCARGITIRNNVFFSNHVQIAFQYDDTGNPVSNVATIRNQAFSKSASQLVLMLASRDDDFSAFGSFDSNYYCRPFKDDGIIFTNWFHNGEAYYNLSKWQSTYSKDLNTKNTPISVASPQDILFNYNASSSPKLVSLDGTHIGLDGVKYSGSVSLPPYTSLILLKTASSNSTGNARNVTKTIVLPTVVM